MRVRRVPCRLAPLCLLAAAVPAWAQEGPARPIIVTGEALAPPPGAGAYGSVTLDRERLMQAASGRVENALLDVAGFQQFRRSDSRSANPSAQGATLRALGGNASSRTLVLLDGVPVSDPFFGYIPYSAITPDRLGSITVTRGAGAGPFGAGAVAGVIEMRSAGRDALPLAAASAFLGSRDAQEVTASLTPDLGAGYASLSGRWERGDGFQTTPAAQRVAASAPSRYRDWSVGLGAAVPLGEATRLQFRGLVFRDDRTLRFRGADSRSAGQDASIRLVHDGDWGIDALAYLQTRDFSNVVISSTSFVRTLDQRQTPSTGIGGKVELRPPVGGAHFLRLGIDARLADGELFEDAYSAGTGALTARRNAGGRTLTTGLFVEDDWTLGRLILTGGARLDRWSIRDGFFAERNSAGTVVIDRRAATDPDFADRAGWRPSLRAGALFRASDALSLRAAAYTGFRLPTLNELYRGFTLVSPGSPAPVIVRTEANAGLGLERLKGVEGGLDITPLPGARVGFTVFYNRLEGAIANVTLPGGTATSIDRQRRNVDAIVARGIELTGEARLADFRLSASYAFTDSRVRAVGSDAAPLDDRRPAQSPRHMASATLAWTPAGGAVASITARHVGAQFEDDLETDLLPAATTFDAYLALPVGRGLTLAARGENLFDKAVVTRNAGGSIDLGLPRTLWLGLRFEG